MRILQADPGPDGWWVLVESDDGEQELLNVPDKKGRKAARPSAPRLRELLADRADTPDPSGVDLDDLDLERIIARLLSAPLTAERTGRLVALGRRLVALGEA